MWEVGVYRTLDSRRLGILIRLSLLWNWSGSFLDLLMKLLTFSNCHHHHPKLGFPTLFFSIFHHLDILDILGALTEISSDTDGRCAILMLICWWYWYFWHYSQSGANAGAFRRSEDQRRQSIDYLRSLFLDALASLGSMLESESVLFLRFFQILGIS